MGLEVSNKIYFKNILLLLPILFFTFELVSAGNGCNIADPECGPNPSNNCDVRQNTTFNPGTYNLPNGIDVCAHNIVLDCNGSTLTGSANDPPISLIYINGSTIKNCIFVGGRSIDLLSSNSNIIANNSAGISVRYSNYNLIKNNNASHNFDESGVAGIEFYTSDYNILESNIANSHRGIGIFFRSSRYNNFTNNTVNSNVNSGIRLDFGSSSNVLANNTVNLNGGEGGILIVKSSANVLINNILTSNGGGISMFHHLDPSGQAQSFDNKAIGNTVIGSGYGIYTSAGRNTIVNNVVYRNSVGGIVVAGSDSNIVNNTANFNEYGFILDHFSGNFTNNVANSNNQTGIYLVSTGDANVSNNIANMNNQTGIFIQGAGPQRNIIADNIANSNGQNGIYTYASGKNNIRNNIVNSNGQYGILVYSYAEDNLTNNTANSNGFAGISLLGTNNNDLVNNTANNNRAYGLLIDKSNDNRVNSNTFCANSLLSGFYDLAKLEGSGNSGVNNTCDNSFNWTESLSGCTYSCSYPQLIIITQFFPSNTLGQFSSHKLKAGGGNPPYRWSLVNGTLPSGMILNSDGVINGTPTNAGDFTFTVRVTDSTNQITEKTFTKIVYVTLPPVKLSINKWGTIAVPGRVLDYFIAVTNVDVLPSGDFGILEILDNSLLNLTYTSPIAESVFEEEEIQYVFWNLTTLQPRETKILNYKVKLNDSTSIGTKIFGSACRKNKTECNWYDYNIPDLLGYPSSELIALMQCVENKMEAHSPQIPKGQITTWQGNHGCGPSMHFGGSCAGFIGALAVDYGLEDKEALYGDDVIDFAYKCGAAYAACENGIIGRVKCTSGNADHVHININRPECNPRINPPPDCETHKQNTTRPVDPNEKGVVANKFIKTDQTLVYPIHFENIGEVEALDIFVTDVLDSNLNYSTVQLITPNATFDSSTGIIKWSLLGINLQPNETGVVLFSVKPKQGLISGTEIKNNATIQFEIFENITTNNTLNIIDDVAPSCTMNPLPNTTSNPNFIISWNGSDLIGEIESYTIFVSINNGAYNTLIDSTADTSFNFTGNYSSNYGFICIAKDTAGNVEIQYPTAETSIFIQSGSLFTCGDATGDKKVLLNDIIYLVNYVFKGGSEPKIHKLSGDADNNNLVNLADIIYEVNYIFKGGSKPKLRTSAPFCVQP